MPVFMDTEIMNFGGTPVTVKGLLDAWERAEQERIERMLKPDDALFTAALAAYDALQAVPYRSPERPRLEEAHAAASLAWLRERKGAGLGDCVCALYGWAKPRDIIVESFHIERGSSRESVFFVFHGPGTTAKGVRRQGHLTHSTDSLMLVSEMPQSLQRFLDEEARAKAQGAAQS